MGTYLYPPPGHPNVYINPRWIAVPVHTADSIANCYINGTGVADFAAYRDWDYDPKSREFRLKFTSQSPLEPADVVLPEWTSATVGLAHVDRSTDDSSDDSFWLLDLQVVEVQSIPPTTTDLEVIVYGSTASDVRIDRIAYQIDLLVYRPSFNRPKMRFYPSKVLFSEVARLAGLRVTGP